MRRAQVQPATCKAELSGLSRSFGVVELGARVGSGHFLQALLGEGQQARPRPPTGPKPSDSQIFETPTGPRPRNSTRIHGGPDVDHTFRGST